MRVSCWSGARAWAATRWRGASRRTRRAGRASSGSPDASDADLLHCYRHARALVNVSLCEGFGLPLVEALRHGLRVIASDIPVFREVAAGAAEFVPPGDAERLAQAVASILREPAGMATDAVPETATWDDSARALLGLLRQGLP